MAARDGDSKRPSRAERDHELAMARVKLGTRAVVVGGALAAIALSWIPLQVFAAMVDDLAGEDTRVSISVLVGVSVSIAISLAGVNALLLYKMRKQRGQLVRLRQERDEFEREVLKLKGKEDAE